MNKKEFIYQLKRLRIKTKFEKNLKLVSTNNIDFWKNPRTIDMLFTYTKNKGYTLKWFWLIQFSFEWNLSPEGHEYWAKISNENS